MPAGETAQHRRLKELALAWAARRAWSFAAAEVRIPRSGYRADVAATAVEGDGRVAVFECKQSRADLLKDAHAEAQVRSRIAELTERQRTLEALLAVHRPELRRCEAFWPEFDRWDFEAAEHRSYASVLRELAMMRRRVSEGTKFAKMRRWRCADRLYLVLEADLHAPAEVPAGWGLLVRQGSDLRLEREAEELGASGEQRAAWREAIAAKLAGPRWPAPTARAEGDLLFAD